MSKPLVIYPDGQHVNWDQIQFHNPPSTGGAGWTYVGGGTGSYNAGSPYLNQAMLTAIVNATRNGDEVVDLSVLFAVTVVSLDAGSYAAGDPVTLTGTGFKTGAEVLIGGQVVPGVITVVSGTSITFTAPDRTLEPFLSVYNAGNPARLSVANSDNSTGVTPAIFNWS